MITATGASLSTGGNTDCVLRLYDPLGSIVAENDDAWPRTNRDPELIYRAGRAGTYFVEVMEYSDWRRRDNVAAMGGPAYTYTLRIDNLIDKNRGVNLDTERGDSAASAVYVDVGATTILAGTLGRTTDQDWFRFTAKGDGPQRVEAIIMPPGVSG